MIYHTVQSGDTLIAIAATYGTTVDALRIANQLDSDLLRVGQTLMVPNQGWTPTATATLFAQLTPTLCSPFAYPAPNLLWPPDNFVLSGKDAPTLAWASPATLKPNEFYVLNISTGAGAQKKSVVVSNQTRHEQNARRVNVSRRGGRALCVVRRRRQSNRRARADDDRANFRIESAE